MKKLKLKERKINDIIPKNEGGKKWRAGGGRETKTRTEREREKS